MNTNPNLIGLRVLRPEGGFVRLELVGQITRSDWPADYDPLVELCGRDVHSSKVLMNLSQANYLDSSGVSWLLACNKRFKEAGGSLVLHSISPLTMQFLKLMRMDLALTLAPDETTARQKANGVSHV
jgi:anti-sigma B factor antagonist